MTKELTARQKEVLDYICDRIVYDGIGPTIREIGDEFGFKSPNGVVGHLRALEKKGYIRRDNNKSRSIFLSEAMESELHGLPLVGRVSAGGMMEAIEQHEHIEVGDFWTRKGTYVLQVDGDSMIEAQIAPGDYLVVEKRRTASAGDIVIARNSEGEATVKYWFPEKNRIRLQPANKRLKPIYTKDAKVIGLVVGVVRNLN